MSSVVFMLTAALLLFILASQLFDRATAALSVLAFLSIRDVAFAAADLRPYAPGIALVLASMLALLRLARKGRPGDAIIYTVSIAAVVHVHYLFALIIIAHAAYLWASGGWRTLRRGSWIILGVGVPSLCLPALPGLIDFAARRETLASPFGSKPYGILFVPILVLGVLLFVRTRSWADRRPLEQGTLALVSLWAIAPPLFLYLASAITDTNVFQARYALSSTPALAILVGMVLRTIPTRILAFGVAASLLITTTLTSRYSEHWVEDWQAAQRYIQTVSAPRHLLLVRAGLVESQDIGWLSDGERISYLTSPLSYYRVPGEIVALPFDASRDAVRFLETVSRRALDSGMPFVVVTNYSHVLDDWFRIRFATTRFEPSQRRDFGVVSVTHFRPQER